MHAALGTLAAFIEANGLRMKATPTDHNPHMEDTRDYAMHHWRCVITSSKTRGRFSLIFSQGPAIQGDPTLSTVLDCVACDGAGFDNATSFEDWCSEYGYDTDSREAERIYKAVERQTTKLKAFLGESATDTLFYHTERE